MNRGCILDIALELFPDIPKHRPCLLVNLAAIDLRQISRRSVVGPEGSTVSRLSPIQLWLLDQSLSDLGYIVHFRRTAAPTQ